MNLGLILGLTGSLIGIAAGLAGTYLAIASTDGPRERVFMVRGATVCWLAVGAVLSARFFLPLAWPMVTVAGLAALRPALRWWSDRQAEIRVDERAEQRRTPVADRESSLL